MQLQKSFMHPIHLVNQVNYMLKKTLKEIRPKSFLEIKPPMLSKNLSYYFTMASQPRHELNQMLYAICCFSEDGEIIFSYHSAFDVSLWSFRRLGMARTADKIERTIRVAFKRKQVPLDPNNPFQKVDENLYWCNIDWFSYNLLIRK